MCFASRFNKILFKMDLTPKVTKHKTIKWNNTYSKSLKDALNFLPNNLAQERNGG